MNEDTIVVYHNCICKGTSFLLQQKDRVVFMVQEYWLLEGNFREEAC
jgi:hypothetical protein